MLCSSRALDGLEYQHALRERDLHFVSSIEFVAKLGVLFWVALLNTLIACEVMLMLFSVIRFRVRSGKHAGT